MISVLSELHKSSIRASDIAAQYWCERQMEYNYRYGRKITAQIKEGRAIHEELESETNVPIILQPRNYPDALYRDLYRSYMALLSLPENKRTREVSIYGSINGYTVVGKIDELQTNDGEITILEDKTKQSDTIPSESQSLTHKVQIMTYKKMVDDIKDGSYGLANFTAAYHTDEMALSEEFKRQLDAIKVQKELQGVSKIAKRFFDAFASVGKVSGRLHIRYINQFSGKEIKLYKFDYRKEEMDDIIKYILKYWNGERESMPVPENEQWKCNYCVFFGKECKVWYKQKALT
ncbi:MAG: PD-(D/E)XK nuclease family protein [Candidatus Micrarchaeaceae archaeon]|nr:hypothetical protein [Candidatus Micrarchaeota archaeon]